MLESILCLKAEDFSITVKPHSILLRNGSFSVLVHRKYPLLTLDDGFLLSFSATKNGTNQTLEVVENSPEVKSVRWTSMPEENREGERVQSEFTVEIRKHFPGVLIDILMKENLVCLQEKVSINIRRIVLILLFLSK